jgi:hypothetical protein
MYAYIYAYFKASKPACQEGKVKINAKNCPKELNCYHKKRGKKGSEMTNGIFVHASLTHMALAALRVL